jgi:hypothetical protein
MDRKTLTLIIKQGSINLEEVMLQKPKQKRRKRK